MRLGWLGILLLCCCSLVNAAPSGAPSQIQLVSEVWPKHTNANGTGLVWDVLQQVFAPLGIKVQIRNEPYSRALGLALRGQADAVVGLYHQEIEGLVYPRWPYAEDAVTALGLARLPVPSVKTLANYRLLWMRGYGFQNYLPGLSNYREVQRRDGVIAMLHEGRADYFIDDDDELNGMLASVPDPEVFRLSPLQYLSLYIAFAQTADGRALAKLYDQRMDVLVHSGQLRAIFQRWNDHYPYD